jgi:hypothetical protein
MGYWTDDRVRSLSLFLSDQTNEVGRAGGGDFVVQRTELHRSCVRYKFR